MARQNKLLSEMAESSSLDPDTVSKARVAISRDLVFFEHVMIGKIEISPVIESASRILADLFLGRME